MVTKFNLLLKLKVLKVIYLNNIIYTINSYILQNCSLFYNYFLYFYFFKFLSFAFKFKDIFFNFLNLKFLKNFFNQFYLYNGFFFEFSKKEKFSNYNLNYLFLYDNYSKLKLMNFENKFISAYKFNNLFFFKFFILKYLNFYFFDKKLIINLQKNQFEIFELNNVYNLIYSKSKRLLFLKSLKISLKSFIKFLLISLYSKDVILIKNFIKYILESIHFKKHKSFLYNLKILFYLISSLLFHSLKILGIYIKIKGKIGVGGNLKKRRYSLKIGKFSFTKKNQKLSYNKDSIRTYSGVLGFEIYLSYF